VLYPLCAQETVGNLLYITASSPHRDHLEAVMFIQVYVHRGKDLVAEPVLQFSQLLGQLAHLMAVDDSNGSYCFLIGNLPLLLDQALPNEPANRFRTIGKAKLGNEAVEFCQEFSTHGHPKPRCLSHCSLLSRTIVL
jgi:hypothetical protein